MFVRVKKVGTYRYLQIAENRREGQRVKQTIIATLGRLDKLAASSAIDQLLRSAARFAARAARAMRRRGGRGAHPARNRQRPGRDTRTERRATARAARPGLVILLYI